MTRGKAEIRRGWLAFGAFFFAVVLGSIGVLVSTAHAENGNHNGGSCGSCHGQNGVPAVSPGYGPGITFSNGQHIFPGDDDGQPYGGGDGGGDGGSNAGKGGGTGSNAGPGGPGNASGAGGREY